MKTAFMIGICAIAFAIVALGQTPAATQTASASPLPSATASISPSGDLADQIQQRIEKKLKGHHGRHGIVISGDGGERSESDDIPGEVIPIVAITMLTVFGAPVLIVGVIMLINYMRARSLHRTVQTMVEKGQPVPTALLAPPALPRPRSDLRRGVILVMVGLGIGVFFLATDWGDSSWSIGAIPFLIGVGYLIVWKLESKKNDNPPPVP
jgi:hypothetical protein